MSAETPSANEEYCSSCGEIIKSAAEICPDCGVRVNDAPNGLSSSKDRTTAAIFALILGRLGAHHFYLGNTGRGILYLIFVWTFIPMAVAFIEGIIYLTKTDEEFQRKYVTA